MRSVILKGNEAVAKQAGQVSFFLEQCLTKPETTKGTCNGLFYAVFILSVWYGLISGKQGSSEGRKLGLV